MIMYKCGNTLYSGIVEVEAEKTTYKSVWINGKRSPRKSSYVSYYDTWEEAHQNLLEKIKARLDTARSRFYSAQDDYDNVKEMKKP